MSAYGLIRWPRIRLDCTRWNNHLEKGVAKLDVDAVVFFVACAETTTLSLPFGDEVVVDGT